MKKEQFFLIELTDPNPWLRMIKWLYKRSLNPGMFIFEPRHEMTKKGNNKLRGFPKKER